MLSYTIGPTLGNARAGATARLAGVGGSIVWGGVACVAGTLALAAALPAFLRYDGRDGLARKIAEDEAWAASAAAHRYDGTVGSSSCVIVVIQPTPLRGSAVPVSGCGFRDSR